MSDETWLEVRRFGGPVEAEMAKAFLLEHGVRAALCGPTSTTHSLVRFAGDPQIRLLVPPSDVEEAREALAALAPETLEMPFRGAAPRERENPTEGARARDAAPRPRSVLAVLLAASVLPIAAAHLTQGCRGPEVVVRRRPGPDFALAPAEVEVPLPPAFADRPALGPCQR